MAGAILEIVLTDALKVRPMPPWFTQCLQSVEVFVKIKHFFNVLAPLCELDSDKTMRLRSSCWLPSRPVMVCCGVGACSGIVLEHVVA
jgi:hypothetical protein